PDTPKQLPQKQARAALQPVLLLSYVSLGLVGLCFVALIALTIFDFTLGLPLAIAKDFVFMLLLFWSMVGPTIETRATIRLAEQSGRDDYAAAEMTCMRALSLEQKLFTRKPNLHLMYSNMALMQLAQGKFQEAETALRQALALMERDKGKSKHYLKA